MTQALTRRSFLSGGVAAASLIGGVAIAAPGGWSVNAVDDAGLVGDDVTNNTPVLQNLAYNLASAGGGVIEISEPGKYILNDSGYVFALGALHSYCIALPSNVHLLLGPSVVIKLGDFQNSILFMNDGIESGGNKNIGIVGGTLDLNRANQTASASGGTLAAMYLHNIDDFTMKDVKIIEARQYALYLLGVYNSRFENVDANGSDGGAYHFGNDYIRHGASARFNHVYMNNLVARNLGGTESGTHGNPMAFCGDNCHSGFFEAYNVTNGFKVQSGTSNCRFDHTLIHDSASSGMKIDGDWATNKRISFGLVDVYNCGAYGFSMQRTEDSSVETILARNCGFNEGYPNVLIGDDCQRTRFGHISSEASQFGGVVVRHNNTRRIDINSIMSRNEGQGDPGVQANVVLAGDGVDVGVLTAIDDQFVPTARYALNVWSTASNVNVKRLNAEGAFTSGAVKNASSNNIKISDIQIDDAPELQEIIT